MLCYAVVLKHVQQCGLARVVQTEKDNPRRLPRQSKVTEDVPKPSHTKPDSNTGDSNQETRQGHRAEKAFAVQRHRRQGNSTGESLFANRDATLGVCD